MQDESATYEALTRHFQRIATLDGARAVLAWDQQTYQPPAGAAARGAQLTLLTELSHEALVDPQVTAWLDALEAHPPADPARAAGVAHLRKWVRRERCVPAALVREIATLQSEAFEAWIEAKQHSRYDRFAPVLGAIVRAMRTRAQAIDPHRHPYDVLLDEYDAGTTAAGLTHTFGRLQTGLTSLLQAIARAPHPPPCAIPMPVDSQLAVHREVARALGYDLNAGRIDLAEHPFTIGIGTGDVRITTHLHAEDLLAGLSGTIHEVGHGLYEQGLPRHLLGTGLEGAASMGLHESQSRFWENQIGRSRPFLAWLAGHLSARDSAFAALDPEALYRGQNRVSPGLIRIHADEVTYNLHIIARFDLELALFEDRVTVDDLPAAWNARYRDYLGVEVPDDAHGVLQDVHWSGGAFGYFPSYTLGNLYAASLTAGMEAALPDLWHDVAAGRFDAPLAWLRTNLHQHGARWEAPELVARAVGARDAVADLLDHLWRRHGALYGAAPG
jgi:carboxypeptidase Taq